MINLNTYLTFDGNCEEAFEFYKSVFGGEFETFSRFGDNPMEGMPELDKETAQRVMHVAYKFGGKFILMGSDTMPSMTGVDGHKFTLGDNYSLSINAESDTEADTLFNGLSAGGNVTMPLQKTFWGAYFGMWTDKFGIQWMINYDYPQA